MIGPLYIQPGPLYVETAIRGRQETAVARWARPMYPNMADMDWGGGLTAEVAADVFGLLPAPAVSTLSQVCIQAG